MLIYRLRKLCAPNEEAAPGVVTESPDKAQHEERVKRLQAERAKAQAELQAEREAREKLEARLHAAEEERKKAALEKMQPDERVATQLRELQTRLEKTEQERQHEKLFFNNKVRALELVAYRERALRDAGEEIIPELVAGSSEEEIDQAMENSRRSYKRMAEQFAAKFGRQLPTGAEPGQPPAPVPVGVAALPPNPSYPQPPYAGGFPTATNPVPVTEAAPSGFDFKEMTTEEAVRSGKYSGELRENMHKMLKNMGNYPGQSGNAPRYWAQPHPPTVGHLQQPNGVMQPQGTPMAAPVNPQQYQAVPQQMGDPRGMAQQAIARTHQGSNPVMSQNTGAVNALQDAQAHAARTGQSPQQAFANRFSPTPPVQGQQ